MNWATFEVNITAKKLTELARLEVPDEIVEDTEDRQVITRFTPLGVIVGIVAWNFPLSLAAGKIAPAVLTGNTVIVKASYVTSPLHLVSKMNDV